LPDDTGKIHREHSTASQPIARDNPRGPGLPRAQKLVLEWMGLHAQELLENWELANQGQPLKRIAPLE
jgi:hypothetical protein